MGDLFQVFTPNPSHMPGQGLARPDNFDYNKGANEYTYLLNNFYNNQDYQLGSQLALNQRYSPQYLDLGLSNTGRALNGADGQSGLLALYSNQLPQLTQAQAQADAATRTGDIYNIASQGAAGRAAWDSINPEQAQMLSRLTADANAGVAAGGQLRPADVYNITKQVKGDYAGRGFSSGIPASELAQAMQLYTNSEQLRAQRQAAAANAVNVNNANYSPLYSILMQRSNAPVQAMSFLGQGQQTGYVNDQAIANSGQAGWAALTNAYNQNQENNRVQAGLETKIGQQQADIWNGWGKMFAGSGVGCWAALEVFGANNPDWLVFRYWMANEAPRRLRDWYQSHGESWAKRLNQNPMAKAVVRRWMERRIYG